MYIRCKFIRKVLCLFTKPFIFQTSFHESIGKFRLTILRNHYAFPNAIKTAEAWKIVLTPLCKTTNSNRRLLYSTCTGTSRSDLVRRGLSMKSDTTDGQEISLDGHFSNRCSCCGLNTRGTCCLPVVDWHW